MSHTHFTNGPYGPAFLRCVDTISASSNCDYSDEQLFEVSQVTSVLGRRVNSVTLVKIGVKLMSASALVFWLMASKSLESVFPILSCAVWSGLILSMGWQYEISQETSHPAFS